jgi:hypothetical protein
MLVLDPIRVNLTKKEAELDTVYVKYVHYDHVLSWTEIHCLIGVFRNPSPNGTVRCGILPKLCLSTLAGLGQLSLLSANCGSFLGFVAREAA